VETARAILGMGSSTIKFSLEPQGGGTNKPRTLAETAQNDPAVKAVFEMPFARYVVWVSPLSAPGGGPFATARLGAERQELYDLGKYLLKTYSGSGKSFYLGNWEGDWLLTRMDANATPSAEEVQRMVDWATARQQAVDDARRDTAHTNVSLYYYVEVNRAWDAMDGKVRVANKVLPRVNPDYVSYSSYDSQGGDVESDYAEALDYLATQLPAKSSIPGKRVFIGEYGMPLMGNSAQAQADLARHVMRGGLRWGCPFVLYWEMYNNEVTPDGRQRGFWLIDDHGVKQPVYYLHQRFYEQARAYVAQFSARNGRVPSREEFGEAALAWLPIETPPGGEAPVVQGNPFVDELHDYSKMFSHSGHLRFDATNPDYFEGRKSRLVREGIDKPRHFTYHGNGIERFKIIAYVFGDFTGSGGAKVRVQVSSDSQQWQEVAVAPETRAIKDGWARVELTSATKLATPAAYLRIELCGDAAVYSPQVAEVQLFTLPPKTLPASH
jgi:hypothetical protein